MKSLFYSLSFILLPAYVVRNCLYLAYKHVRHSGLMKINTQKQAIGKIIASYHTIEKGLTMPSFRPGFGRGALQSLTNQCNVFIDKYGTNNSQLKHAIQVILEYRKVHLLMNEKIPSAILLEINKLEARVEGGLFSSQQHTISNTNYFSNSCSPFSEFSKSRASVRNFSDEIVSERIILKAVEIAQSAPSACNRQSVRIHSFRDSQTIKELLALQGGNRGFGHTVSNLLLVTTDISAYFGPNELTIGWVDGGMFAMNLCLSLHYLNVASCPLNCSMSIEKQRSIRKLVKIPDNELFVLFLAIGYPPSEFKCTVSKRYPVKSIFVSH